jgi:hypothetical protein
MVTLHVTRIFPLTMLSPFFILVMLLIVSTLYSRVHPCGVNRAFNLSA